MQQLRPLIPHRSRHAQLIAFAVLLAACSFAWALQGEPSSSDWVAIGQRLFFDKRLSSDGRISCASCHQPDRAFADGRALAVGVAGQLGTRNTPSLVDVSLQELLFWDGRRDTLEMQAIDPLLNSREHGLKDETEVLSVVRADRSYVKGFRSVKRSDGDVIWLSDIARALAAFQRTLVDGASPFDRYQAGDVNALTPQAQRGWQIFRDRAQCIRCHLAAAPKALFTDHGFHSLRIGLKGVERKLAQLTTQLAKLREDGRAQDHSVLSDPDVAALGRFAITLDPKDIGKFKTPSLRNVAMTAPYMHDGSVPTLVEAVDLEIYYRSIEDGRPLILTAGEKADLVAFLESLTGWPRSPYMTHHSGGSQDR